MRLSPNFTVAEVEHSQTAVRLGLDNSLPFALEPQARKMASIMEMVRTVLGGRPITVSSWYRSPEVNKAVGSSPSSAHTKALAVDFTCPSFGRPRGVAYAIAHNEQIMREVDQLIIEFDAWVHIGLSGGDAPRHQIMTARAGKNWAGRSRTIYEPLEFT